MATLVHINEVSIISIDKSEDSWEIEGEILFEEDLSCEFAATYLPSDDEFEDLSFSIEASSIGSFDKKQLKEMIVEAASEFGDD